MQCSLTSYISTFLSYCVKYVAMSIYPEENEMKHWISHRKYILLTNSISRFISQFKYYSSISGSIDIKANLYFPSSYCTESDSENSGEDQMAIHSAVLAQFSRWTCTNCHFRVELVTTLELCSAVCHWLFCPWHGGEKFYWALKPKLRANSKYPHFASELWAWKNDTKSRLGRGLWAPDISLGCPQCPRRDLCRNQFSGLLVSS